MSDRVGDLILDAHGTGWLRILSVTPIARSGVDAGGKSIRVAYTAIKCEPVNNPQRDHEIRKIV